MQRLIFAALVASALVPLSAAADPLTLTPDRAAAPPPVRIAAQSPPRGSYGGGFIEFLFGDGNGSGSFPASPDNNTYRFGNPDQAAIDQAEQDGRRAAADPRYQRQVVDYTGREPPGTIIVDTPQRFLFLVQEGGKAVRYGIGVGRPGFTWAGVKQVSMKREWPDWRPPAEMLHRRPNLPRYMPGGPDNPLGARAMYLGSSLYRIHGSNEPWTIGTQVSSGCIRMRNEDVIDLYERVKVGTKVVVI